MGVVNYGMKVSVGDESSPYANSVLSKLGFQKIGSELFCDRVISAKKTHHKRRAYDESISPDPALSP